MIMVLTRDQDPPPYDDRALKAQPPYKGASEWSRAELMEGSCINKAHWEFINPDLWHEPISKDADKIHLTTFVARASKDYSSELLFDDDLLFAYREEFEGWAAVMFERVHEPFRRELRRVLRHQGVYTGRSTARASQQLAGLIQKMGPLEWKEREFQMAKFDPRSYAYKRQQTIKPLANSAQGSNTIKGRQAPGQSTAKSRTSTSRLSGGARGNSTTQPRHVQNNRPQQHGQSFAQARALTLPLGPAIISINTQAQAQARAQARAPAYTRPPVAAPRPVQTQPQMPRLPSYSAGLPSSRSVSQPRTTVGYPYRSPAPAPVTRSLSRSPAPYGSGSVGYLPYTGSPATSSGSSRDYYPDGHDLEDYLDGYDEEHELEESDEDEAESNEDQAESDEDDAKSDENEHEYEYDEEHLYGGDPEEDEDEEEELDEEQLADLELMEQEELFEDELDEDEEADEEQVAELEHIEQEFDNEIAEQEEFLEQEDEDEGEIDEGAHSEDYIVEVDQDAGHEEDVVADDQDAAQDDGGDIVDGDAGGYDDGHDDAGGYDDGGGYNDDGGYDDGGHADGYDY